MAPSSSSVRVALSSDQRGQRPDMSIPHLSLGGLDHYSPELRDRILEKLSAAHLSETAYQMLTPARLRSLTEIEAADATVVSFYMQLSPDRRVGGAWHTFFSSSLRRDLEAHSKPASSRRNPRRVGPHRAGSRGRTPRARSWRGVLLKPKVGLVASDRGIGTLARWGVAEPETLSETAGAHAR